MSASRSSTARAVPVRAAARPGPTGRPLSAAIRCRPAQRSRVPVRAHAAGPCRCATAGPAAGRPAAATSMRSRAITRYVVYLPPAIAVSPGATGLTVCSRLSRVVSRAPARRHQRPQAGEHALDVGVGRAGRAASGWPWPAGSRCQPRLAAGRRRIVRPLGVGVADQPVVAPRDHEQHALLGPGQQPGVHPDAVARDHDVHALGGPTWTARQPVPRPGGGPSARPVRRARRAGRGWSGPRRSAGRAR